MAKDPGDARPQWPSLALERPCTSSFKRRLAFGWFLQLLAWLEEERGHTLEVSLHGKLCLVLVLRVIAFVYLLMHFYK